MAIATLEAIITKVRRLTGTNNTFQLNDGQIIDYINSFYLFDFPAQFRSLKLKDKYTFNTSRGIDTYPFDSDHFSTVEMPCYCAKREIKLFQDPWSFYAINFNWQQLQVFTTGTGAAGPYAGTLQAVPIIRSTNNNPAVVTTLSSTTDFLTAPSVPFFPGTNIARVQNILITATDFLGNTLNVTDDGAGNLIGDCLTGTINYTTGAIANLVFTQLVPQGNEIQCQYNPVTLSIPLSILFFQNQFTLRPVPDRGYTVELVAYRLPSQALLGTTSTDTPNMSGRPELQEWWETLAFGASKKIFQDRLDPDGVGMMEAFLQEAYALNESRTYAQLGKQNMSTLFVDQLRYNYGSGSFTFGAGGSV